MRRNWLILLIASLLLSGCFLQKKQPEKTTKTLPKARHVKTVKLSVPSYSRLIVEGRINASVHSGYSQPMVILRGDPRDLHEIITEVENDTLLVHLGKGYPRYGPVKAEIRTRYLNYLRYKGEGTLQGNKLRSNDLELDIDNKGTTSLGGYLMLRKLTARGDGLLKIRDVHSKHLSVDISENAQVDMKGAASLRQLEISGDGRFNMHWLNGPEVCIRATGGQPFIKLAGLVLRLDVELHDKAIFEGYYLRAERAFVKTFGESVARIHAIKRQHTMASDRSNIYFYNLSEMRTDFMAYDGSVLDMRQWQDQAENEYTTFNKWL